MRNEKPDPQWGALTQELKKQLGQALAQEQPDYARINRILRALEGREAMPETPDGDAAFADHFCREPIIRADRLRRRRIIGWAAFGAAVLVCVLILVSVMRSGDLPVSSYGKLENGHFILEKPTFITPGLDEMLVFESDNPTLCRIRQELTDRGIGAAIPSWIPEGFTLDRIYCQPAQNDSTEVWFYLKGSRGTILYAAHWKNGGNGHFLGMGYRIGGGVPELYGNGHMRFLVFREEALWEAVWATESCEYFIGTTSSEDDLYAMLDSIYRVDGLGEAGSP